MLAGTLAGLPQEAFAGLLILCRLGAAAMLLPGLGEQEVPATVRLGLALTLVLLLFAPLAPAMPAPPEHVAELARLVLTEVGIGLWLGLLARLVSLALAQAGQMVALLIGLASPLQLDALMGGQTTAPARLFSLLGTVLLLSGGLYSTPLRALAESYALLPPGAALPLDGAAMALAQGVADSFALALRLAGPLVLAAVLTNLALALLARIAPQVPVYTIASPGQIGLGLLLLSLILPTIMTVWLGAATELFGALPGSH